MRVGDTVVWTQRDSGATHTATSGVSPNADGAWDSDWLQQGQTFSFTFTQPGTFPYFCTIHQSMTAVVTVMGAGSVGTTTPPEPTPASAGDDGMGGADDEYS